MPSLPRFAATLSRLCAAAFLTASFWVGASARQVAPNSSSADGTTPMAMKPGSPAGSYSLSGFDDVNLFSRRLNFHLPLLRVGGRGEAGHTLMLAIQQNWIIRHARAPSNCGPTGCAGVTHTYVPDPNDWETIKPGYGPGVLHGRRSGHEYRNVDGCDWFAETLTRLTFTAPDGTELDLRDKLYDGQPRPNQPAPGSPCWGTVSRGKVFVTADGSAATFISDTDISDVSMVGDPRFFPSGYLMLRDGTRYRVDSGLVSWIRDRNGNTVRFDYTANRVTAITDSLGRQVTIEYEVTDQTYGLCDRIHFKGFGGEVRTLYVKKASLENALRGDYTLQTYQQLFPGLNGSSSSQFKATVVSGVVLPNDRQYEFRYNSYGDLARAVLPTGGAFEYDYENGTGIYQSQTASDSSDELGVSRRVTERRVYANGVTLESKTTFGVTSGPVPADAPVTVDHLSAAGALLAREKHYFYGNPLATLVTPNSYPAWKDGQEYKTELYDINYADGSATLERSVTHTFAQRAAVGWWTGTADAAPAKDPRLTETVTTLVDSSQVSKQTFSYDQFNNQTDVYEYDFGAGGAGALLRRTHVDYVTAAAYTGADLDPSLGAHLRSLPSGQWISSDVAGATKLSLSTYEYDNYAADARHAPLAPRGNISGLCLTLDSAGSCVKASDGDFTLRGNLTGVTSYANAAAASPSGAVTASTQYDVAGNAVKAVDALGNPTSFYYDDCFGAPDAEARANTAPAELGATLKSFAFPTKVTNALGQSTYTQYDYNLGQAVDSEDVNGVVSSASFDDELDRPTQVVRAASEAGLKSQTAYAYDDLNRAVTSTSDQAAYGDNLLKSQMRYDGLGRKTESRAYESATSYLATKTVYDALGRVKQVSHPFRSGGTPAYTTTEYDALGRPVSVTTPDGAPVTTSYSGNKVTVTDPAGKDRESTTDASGRPTQVVEDPGGLAYVTAYAYDPLGNLRTVTQGAQTRTFVYDSLSRLTSAANPESGTVAYEYDNAGNLKKKTDPRLLPGSTTTRIETTYTYDALNRVKTRAYNDTTPDVAYFYDAQTLPAGAPPFTRGASAGRLTAVTYGGGSAGSYYGYDAAGRVVTKVQQTGPVSYQTGAEYDLSGAVTALTYPSGHAAGYTYDAAGRLSGFTGSLGDGQTRTYAGAFGYDSGGRMREERFGTQTPLYHKLHYNVRGQLNDARLSTASWAANEWDWNRGTIVNFYATDDFTATAPNRYNSGPDNNGNLLRSRHYVPGDAQVSTYNYTEQRYAYDALNRLDSVTEYAGTQAALSATASFKQDYDYDRWGNRTINADGTQVYGTNPGYSIPEPQYSVNAANNRLGVPTTQTGVMAYDAAGNLTTDTYQGGRGNGGTRTYDAENRMTSAQFVDGQLQTATFAYDGEGQRLKWDMGVAPEVWQVYGIGGELLAEYAAGAAPSQPQKEYGYRAGELLVTLDATERVNVALSANGATATASSTLDSNRLPSAAINSDRRGLHWGSDPSTGSGWVDATQNAFPDWLEVAFSGSKTIDEIDVFGMQDAYTSPQEPTEEMAGATYGLSAFDVQYWTGSAWVTAPGGSVTGNTKVWRKFTFPAVTTTKIRVITYGGGFGYSRVLELEAWSGAADARWLVSDHLGTPRMVVDQTGSLAGITRHDYLPFGEELLSGTGGRTTAQRYSQSDGIRQRWVGKERNAQTELDYFLARYYSSAQGRFTSPDEFQGGPHEVYMLGSGDPESQAIPYADISEPQSLNKYQYCLNNPLRYVDPDGHQEQDAEDKRKRAAQGAAIYAGRTLNHDGRLRREYKQRAAQLKGPEASAARKALRAEIRQRSTPLGRGLAEAASKSRAGQLAGKTAEQLAESASRTSRAWNRTGAAFEGAGKALTVVGVGMSAYNIVTAPEGQRGQVVAEEAGAWTGALAGGAGGAKIGAAIGTLIEPGGGTAIGGAVGGVIGGIGGAIAGSEAGRAVYNWFTKKDD